MGEMSLIELFISVIGILVVLYSVALDKMSLGENEERGDN